MEIDKDKKGEDEKINHPKHYNNSPAHCSQCGYKIECIDVTRHMNFNAGNIIKYIWRAHDKNGLEDLKKAQWYLNDLIHYFETMIHDTEKDQWMNYEERYSTWKEAEKGHEKAIQWVKYGCKEDE